MTVTPSWLWLWLGFVHRRGNKLTKFRALERGDAFSFGLPFYGLLELAQTPFSGHMATPSIKGVIYLPCLALWSPQ
jgi:hypothetical protein